jgi:hypothetical protein
MNPLSSMAYLTTKYLLASAIMCGWSGVLILWAIKTAENRRDSKRIYQFLCRSLKDGQYRFQSSEAISAATNLRVSRIAALCTKHPHIERKRHERHMWRVVNTVETDKSADHASDHGVGPVVECSTSINKKSFAQMTDAKKPGAVKKAKRKLNFTGKTKKRGRPRVRTAAYWREYYRLKQREWRAAHLRIKTRLPSKRTAR